MSERNRLYGKNFRITGDKEDPRELNFNIYGLHKKETKDANGDIILIELFMNYDFENGTFSDVAVEELRTYVRDLATGLLTKRITNIKWYDVDGNVQSEKIGVEKFYSSAKGFQANKRARQNILDQASMYFYSQLIANDPLTAEANVDDFEGLTDSAQSKYVKSNTQPLLDIIANSTDNTKPEYRDYMTQAMRDTLLVILNISYN